MKRSGKNWIEWSCFVFSLLLIAAVVTYLLKDALTRGNTPAVIQLELGAAEQRGENFCVAVTAVNRGDQTAEGVRVEVVLTNGSNQERSEFLIDYLPRHGMRQGYVIFQTDPRRGGNLRARTLGYANPRVAS